MRMSLIFDLLFCLFVATLPLGGPTMSAQAAATPLNYGSTPVGRWKTVDDATGKAKSLVFIWQEGGMLYGKIEKLFDADPNDPNPRCGHCEGKLKDRAVVGLRILWDFRKDGDQWSEGRILDPGNGKSYRCHITVQEGGNKLKVRGFIGFSLVGRTQYWLRAQ